MNEIKLSESHGICIKVISDIHLEFLNDQEIEKIKNILTAPDNSYINEDLTTCCILAGDIGHPMSSKYYDLLSTLKESYDYVLVITGNHEYYRQEGMDVSMDQVEDRIREVCKETGCTFLQQSSIIINGLKFVGATFWSDIPKCAEAEISTNMNDFSRIRIHGYKFGVRSFNRLHNQHRSYITSEINNSQEDMVIITHHAPTWRLVPDKYKFSPMTYAFASNNEDILNDNVKLWISGHLHNTKKVYINNTLCITNCCGYRHNGRQENPNFDPLIKIFL